MLARARQLQARALPRGYADAARQFAIFFAAYYSYRIVRGQVDGRAAAAFEHARDVINLERGLHIFIEPSIQAWGSGSQLLMDVASWIYINAQTTITIAALVWLYLFRNSSFYFVRNMMVTAMFIALIGYTVFPTAPPRFLPEWGFIDSVADLTGVRSDSMAINALFNPYAAVPSMHVAYALMIGLPLARLVRWPALRVFWGSYPLLVTFVIVVTGNHFLTDAILGALTAAVSGYSAWWLARARPAAWAFAPAT
jgi:GNAT superfamily N-acetyltransferase